MLPTPEVLSKVLVELDSKLDVGVYLFSIVLAEITRISDIEPANACFVVLDQE